MVFGLYLFGVGCMQIPGCQSTNLHSTLFSTKIVLLKSMSVGQFYKTKAINHC